MSAFIDQDRTTIDGHNDPKFLQFYNEKEFIRVVNRRTTVVVYLNKKPLLIQKDGRYSFMLKNDTYAGYYDWNNVAHPVTGNVDELVEILVGYVEMSDAASAENAKNDPSFSSYTDIKTNFRSSAFDMQSLARRQDNNGDPVIVSEKPDIDTYVIYDERDGLFKLELPTVGKSTDSKVVRQTRQYIPATFVSNVIAMMEVRMDTSGATDYIARVGVFEDQNDITINPDNAGRGVYIQYDAKDKEWSIHVVFNDANNLQNRVIYRQTKPSGSALDFNKSKFFWNIDLMDGEGLSGIELKPDDPNVFVFHWLPNEDMLKVGLLRNDRVVYIHEVRMKTDVEGSLDPNPGELIYPVGSYISKLNLPLRWEIRAPGDGVQGTGHIYQGQGIVYDGNNPPLNRLLTFDTDTYARNLNSRNSTAALFGIRLKEKANRAKILPQKLVIVQHTEGGVGKWELIRGGNVSGQIYDAETDTRINVTSSAQLKWDDKDNTNVQIASPINNVNGFDEQLRNFELDISDGIVLASDYMHGAGYFSYDLTKANCLLTSKINGEMDEMMLKVTNVYGVIDVIARLEWFDLE